MTIGNVGNNVSSAPVTLKSSAARAVDTAVTKAPVNKSGDSTVSISDDAQRALLAEADKQAEKGTDALDEGVGMAKSFAYGALGLDHPDTVPTENDTSYDAGKWLSAIGTVATVLLAIA